jgi:ribosomal protein S18 acetylase RimI-like enzyme
MVERLTSDAREELTQALSQAFEEHPMVPALGARPEDAGALVRALVDFHWHMKSLLTCGIRMDEGLVCGSLSVDAREDPSLLALARLAWGVRRRVGGGALGSLLDVERHKPLLRERHLELVMLATQPAYQRRGLGRHLLQFLYREAMREGYSGILLVTDRDTPAFGLYRSEGFEVEREFEVAQQRLCWMCRAA